MKEYIMSPMLSTHLDTFQCQKAEMVNPFLTHHNLVMGGGKSMFMSRVNSKGLSAA
jgi:hypothetical protein